MSDDHLANRVIAAFGGLRKTAKATGWPMSTVQGWRRSRTIPEWRRDGLIAAAEREGIDLPDEFLAEQQQGAA